MNTPSMPGDGPGKASRNASGAGGTAGKAGRAGKAGAGTAQKTAAGAAKGGAKGAAGAAEGTAQGVRKGAAQAGGQVAALPGRVAGLARLMTLARLLRAVPVVAAGVAGVVVGRLIARRR
ncbi:hypothetical protein [Spirillospora sp. NPDC048819]|uniref:hypothetical protein n=1 Tax=Spirillospora sp. NPDC048819 TaxID=3155268 RepID=UPI00340F647D